MRGCGSNRSCVFASGATGLPLLAGHPSPPWTEVASAWRLSGAGRLPPTSRPCAPLSPSPRTAAAATPGHRAMVAAGLVLPPPAAPGLRCPPVSFRTSFSFSAHEGPRACGLGLRGVSVYLGGRGRPHHSQPSRSVRRSRPRSPRSSPSPSAAARPAWAPRRRPAAFVRWALQGLTPSGLLSTVFDFLTS